MSRMHTLPAFATSSTLFKSVEDVANAGKVCILDIDIQGAQSVKKSALSPHYIFIEPPSMDELEARLRGRGTESEEQVLMRLKQANAEMDYGKTPGNFDINIVNNDLDQAYAQLVETLSGWYTLKPATPAPILIAGPSGVGKGTLINKLMKDYPDSFGFSVSHTSRPPRPGEVDGKDYHFSDRETMAKEIELSLIHI